MTYKSKLLMAKFNMANISCWELRDENIINIKNNHFCHVNKNKKLKSNAEKN